ncbi:phosphate acyltransferase PlsX [[Haemophilus] ducreyi]|uniref:phosphate acyltransferase PlsX n=1 Tax=Haemophilus ducreyi TaxID=730 RepID=UPI0006551A7D|nr:phosphate acyltransferase PlsX [[Haemophilus] ducreyi]AKO47956.1 phosphate acyltransferase [[Haemophilus] ducreyi]AKO49344.1 phosphate acyltransferase [[Haemophilus] ducreyi]
MNRLTLALDVMGGDFGPRVTIPALSLALAQQPMLSFVLFGYQYHAIPLLHSLPAEQQQRIRFVHTSRIVDPHVSVRQALRQSKGSSMRLAIEAVAAGEAQACVSGGNTGVLMGLAKWFVEPLVGIDRPALASLIPALNGQASVILDLGANVEADSKLLLQFAEMGNIFAQSILSLAKPRLALLNIGTEEVKGRYAIQQAHHVLKNRADLHYIGFIESDKLMNHLADVIVCDGFCGNIALKAVEGVASHFLALFKQPKRSFFVDWLSSWWGRLLHHRVYRALQRVNPERHNGATLLGLSSVVVKSHGSAGVNAYFYAINHAIEQIQNRIPVKISAGLQKLHQNL